MSCDRAPTHMHQPARVSLGITCLLLVLSNLIALSSRLPESHTQPWLSRLLFSCFLLNVCAFIEQVAVSFGLQAQKWLEQQQKTLAIVQRKQALADNQGEFRLGRRNMGLVVPAAEANAMFDEIDVRSWWAGDRRVVGWIRSGARPSDGEGAMP
eukprot:5601022-Prymnesium_polylepis.1